MKKQIDYAKIESALFNFGFNRTHYGTVRDIYSNEELLLMVVTDRFWFEGTLLSQPIPYKGQVLNMMMVHSMEKIRNSGIIPVWFLKNTNQSISAGINAPSIELKVHVFGYLTGKLWDYYKNHRNSPSMSGFKDMVKNQKLDQEFVLVSRTGSDDKVKYHTIEEYSDYLKSMDLFDLKTESMYDYVIKRSIYLYKFGSRDIQSRNLIMARASYQFGKWDDCILLIDEAHTPYTADYWDASSYHNLSRPGLDEPENIKAVFLRGWIDRTRMFNIPSDILALASSDYVEMYNRFIGKSFNFEDKEIDVFPDDFPYFVKNYLK